MCARLFIVLTLARLSLSLTNTEWEADVLSNQGDVDKIIEHIKGPFKHRFYDDLAEWTDKFGGRECGSQALENSIDYLKDQLEMEGFSNVHKEELPVKGWVRNNESAEMINPRRQQLVIFGLAGTIATPALGIEAEVMVVRSFEELENRASEVQGKIVLYNHDWTGYDTAFRRSGAIEAAKHGAVASAIRSLASYSLYTPHTGSMNYDDSIAKKIPAVALTVEDADMFERMINRGTTVRIKLILGGQDIPNAKSNNLIAELRGSHTPEEVVFFGGHLDSWDRGNGVQDDGVGVIMGLEVLRIVKALRLTPKRTMRFIGWTCEEPGLIGGEHYYETHKDDSNLISLGMEADHGLFKPVGVGYSGSAQGQFVLEKVMSLLTHELGPMLVKPDLGTSADSGFWFDNAQVAVINMWSDDHEEAMNNADYLERYFYYHHTFADHMNAVDKDELDLNQMVWTTAAYVVANLDENLPQAGTADTGIVLASSSHMMTISAILVILFR